MANNKILPVLRVQGETIDPSLLPPASETQAGAIEHATQAEADAGTDIAKAITPATLAGLLGGDVGIGGDLDVAGNTVLQGNLLVNGTTTSINTETVNVADNFLFLNAGHETTLDQSGGIVVNRSAVTAGFSLVGGTFTAGVASTSNPTIGGVTAATFSTGQIVQVSNSPAGLNDGIFEVFDNAADPLVLRGVGLNGTVEDFTDNQLTAQAGANATITHINVEVLRTALAGGSLEFGSGNVTGIVFSAIVTSTNSESFDSNSALYPATDPAAAFSRNGHPIINFDDTTAENVIFNSKVPSSYIGNSLSLEIDWVAESAIAGDVVWGIEFEANAAGGNDIDSDSFAAQQTGTDTTSGTSGVITRTTIVLTQAQADAIAALDSYRMRLQRVAASGSDTMVGDAQVVSMKWSS